MVQAVLERPEVAVDVEERNLSTSRRALLLAWSAVNTAAGDCPEVDALFSPRFRSYGPARDAVGALAPRRQGCRLAEAFSDPEVRVTHMVPQGRDKVVSYLRIRGRHTGEFEGQAPTGREVTADGYVVHRFDADGRIEEEWSLLRWT